MTKNIYTVLKKIDFEKRVEKEIEIIKNVKAKKTLTSLYQILFLQTFALALSEIFTTMLLTKQSILKTRLMTLATGCNLLLML